MRVSNSINIRLNEALFANIVNSALRRQKHRAMEKERKRERKILIKTNLRHTTTSKKNAREYETEQWQ